MYVFHSIIGYVVKAGETMTSLHQMLSLTSFNLSQLSSLFLKVSELCGNFNGNQNDDFIAPNGGLEVRPPAFPDS